MALRRSSALLLAIALVWSGLTPTVATADEGLHNWRVPLTQQATDAELRGFVGAESLLPGQPMELRVHSPSQAVAVDVYRIGDYSGRGGLRVAQLTAQPGVAQQPCTLEDGNMVDCSGWKVTHTLDTTGWLPGMYYVNLRHASGRSKTVPVILRSRSHRGTVTVMSATATHQAYNPMGNFNLYQGYQDGRSAFEYRAHRVSFMRPQAFEGNRTLKVQEYEVGFIQQLESLGVPLSYTTNFALQQGPAQYAGSPAMVFLGHDEYWSLEMRRAAEALRDSGTNLLFLGANTAYWRIRWNADGTIVTSYKDASLDPVQGPTTTDLWRRSPWADPEASLLGSQYACASQFRETAPLVVTDPTFWGFAGLGATAGAQYPGLVGHEIDRLAKQSPESTVVVAHSPLRCTNDDNAFSDITYYSAPSGAGVVNLGSFAFAWAVSPWMESAPATSQAFARGLVRNLVTEAAKGPLGLRHPSVEPAPDFVKNPQLLYVTPGEHLVNGRRWRTSCEPYSVTERCRTEIWGTVVSQAGGRFVQSTGWLFNNLTYKPTPRSVWAGNPLAATGEWTSNGRRWRTECDTAATGRGGCRSYLVASVVAYSVGPDGTGSYAWRNQWTFNSKVSFTPT
ncbi:N,N-dimethylformamidase beta subunit family domain-containing protein [Tessaracoccus sp. ZS01]|uniref:N,N-dimethylformamidase beta subunit family domain-containing protein n=1 Tax=Tessaracoccus sp. ZS01 TaxID=1906324 RepID=UPI00097A9B31|nr:N,N-dimethylformamidase beta subunit family domain-containing protein [Tessaracoccus sp. ZS01]MCG6568489.1 hypothetical protein [Tessaracoccus sp. ZS01]OMG52673.1 hypothetical protein BJN44_12785 [Tessaracoccus sp. ZS01]